MKHWFKELSKEKVQAMLMEGALKNDLILIHEALKAGAEINYPTAWNPLFAMLEDFNLGAIHLLLDAGADIYVRSADGVPLLHTCSAEAASILRTHTNKLHRRLECEYGSGIETERLIKNGKPTVELLHYCGADLLGELFTSYRWHGKEAEALALFEKVKAVLPEYYKPRTDQIDLTPLRRGVTGKQDGSAVARYVRRSATPEAER